MIYLVTGIGRSGTSTTSRILHQRMGVCMGQRLNEDWEDLDFKELNDKFLAGAITYPEWDARIRNVIENRKGNWGLKDPRLSHFLGLYLCYIDPVIIWCKRDREMIIQSLCREYGWSELNAERFHDNRNSMLCSIMGAVPHIEIDFTERLSDKEVLERIGELCLT